MTQTPNHMAAWLERARAVMPRGVTSNFRDWGPRSFVVQRGEGPYIWDVEGKRYIDYRLAYGPIILGHAYPTVVERVYEAMKNGNVFAATHVYEVEAAERIVRMIPGIERVRFSGSGTEATMHALRLARAYTGREKFLKFEGCYHGAHDYVLFSTAGSIPTALGAPNAPIPFQAGSGIPLGIRQYLVLAPYNDLARTERIIRDHAHELAAIFVEPMMGNLSGIMPRPGFLEMLRELADEYGIVLIFDEVKTGFRMGKGGAQAYFGIEADLVIFAKALGNGYPISAITGRADIMDHYRGGRVTHAGTYNGNIVGTAAAAATLDVLDNEDVFGTLEKRGIRLMNSIDEILTRYKVPHRVAGVPAMFGIIMTDEDVHDIRSYSAADMGLYATIAFNAIKRGVMFDPDPREPWFLCYALSEEDVDETLNVFEDAVREALGLQSTVHSVPQATDDYQTVAASAS